MRGPEPSGLVAIFETQDGAEAALDWLRVDGLEKKSVSVLGPADDPKLRDVEVLPELDQRGGHLKDIAEYWGEWGAMIGATAGAGPAVVALAAATVGIGPLAAALLPAIGLIAATTGVGAIASALVGVGLHEQHAREYERALHDGHYVVVVHTDDAASLRAAERELARLGATQIDVHGF